MARPRKQAGELFFDEFAGMPLSEQKVALRILTELHRQSERIERRHGRIEPIHEGSLDLAEQTGD